MLLLIIVCLYKEQPDSERGGSTYSRFPDFNPEITAGMRKMWDQMKLQ